MCGESLTGRNDARGEGSRLDDGGGWFLIFVAWKDDPTAATSVLEKMLIPAVPMVGYHVF